jgi:hypothetical protein
MAVMMFYRRVREGSPPERVGSSAPREKNGRRSARLSG